MCLFYDPTLVKLEGHVAFGLSVSVWVFAGWSGCLLVGVYASGVVCRDVAGWLGLLVTFLKLSGELLEF